VSRSGSTQDNSGDKISQVIKVEHGGRIQYVIQSVTSGSPVDKLLYALYTTFIIFELCVYSIGLLFPSGGALFYQMACYPCCIPTIFTFLYGLFSKRNYKMMGLSIIAGLLSIGPWLIMFGLGFLLFVAEKLGLPGIEHLLGTPTPFPIP